MRACGKALRTATLIMIGALLASACHKAPSVGELVAGESSVASEPVLTNRLWELIELNGSINPLGAGLSPITLRLERSTNRTRGFGGCNRYTGSYNLSGNNLTFGPPSAPQLSCADGMQVEGTYFRTLPLVRAYAIMDGLLVLSGSNGVLARFRQR
jgi:heat shock protein HslJ